MKKIVPIIFSLIAMGVGALSLNSTPKSGHALAEEQIVETFAYNEMLGLVASISGNDVTPVNSGNQLVTYGFRHGDVSVNNIEKFSTFGTNLLGTMDSKQGAFFSNWRMGTSSGDGAIIFFKAESKIYLEIERAKLGADWRDNIDLSIYKNSELVSNKTLSDAETTPEDFTYKVLLEEGDCVYWQIKFDYPGEFRHISMDSAGADWSTLPRFKAKSFVSLSEENITSLTLVETLSASNGASVTSSTGLVDYKVYSGSINDSSLSEPAIYSDRIGNENAYINTENIVITNKSTLSVFIKANYLSCLRLSYLEEEYSSFVFKAYKYISNKSGLKLMYDLASLDKACGNFILNGGEYIYFEFTSLIDEENTMPAIDVINVRELASRDGEKENYPLYNPTDYSTRETFTHKEIAFETARIKCDPIHAKDFDIQLLTGEVNVDNGENLSKFSYVYYEDGIYVGKTIEKAMLLTNGGATFDGNGYSAVSDYRLKTSVGNSVVYKVTAKNDLQLKVTHNAIDGGWADVGGETYIAGIQTDGEVFKLINSYDVINGVNDPDAFAITFNMAQGDTAYYIYGTRVALERNLNIAPNFTSSVDDYSKDDRDDIFGASSIEVRYEDIVTDTINNNYEPVNYKDTLNVSLAHGDVENISLFDNHTGEGRGEFDDALITNNGNDSDTQFKRWQMHAGLLNDNAIIVFTALKDLKVSFLHAPAGVLYNEGASIKYYLSDVDGFTEYKEERYITKDTPENYYAYTAHLLANQSIIIEYTSNDENGYAVFELPWRVNATTDEFNETLVNDYTTARDLQAYKDGKIEDLDDYVFFLDEEAYTVSNYALIESYVDEFKKEVKKLTSKDDVDELYASTISKIDDVLTIQEENERLEAIRVEVRAEAGAYMEEEKSLFTDAQWAEAEALYALFDNDISSMTSETNINIRLQQFKNDFDLLPRTRIQEEQAMIITIVCVAAGVVVVAAAAVITVIVIKKRKAK